VNFIAHVARSHRPENYSPVILYSDDSEPNEDFLNFADWLKNTLQDLKQRKLALPILGPEEHHRGIVEEDYDPYSDYVDQLAKQCNQIWVLDGGYTNFNVQYPFLCGNVKFADMEPTPHLVLPGIFLGTRGFKIYPNVVNNLGITHLIVAKGLDFSSVKHLCVLECNVEDSNEQDMTSCFAACIGFISSALRSPGTKILVQVYGRSRSASIIMAYLMTQKNMNLLEAFDYVHSKCNTIDKTQVWASQLTRFKAHNNSDVDGSATTQRLVGE